MNDFVKVAVYHQRPAVIPPDSLTLPTGSIVFKISSESIETHDNAHRYFTIPAERTLNNVLVMAKKQWTY